MTKSIRRNTTLLAQHLQTLATGDTQTMTPETQNDIATTIADINEAETKPAKKSATKKPVKAKAEKPAPAPKAEKPAKPAPAPKAEKPVEPPKPQPVTFNGFEVAEGVNPSDIAKEEAEARAAFAGLKEKDAEALPRYLIVGRFMTSVAAMFKSTKLFGQYRAANMPESDALDAGLRSHCGWLYRELTNPASDLFPMLGLTDSLANDPATVYAERVAVLMSYRTQNPQVINRHYREAEKKATARVEAAKRGIEAETDEEAVKAVKGAEKAEAEKAQAALVKKALKAAKRLLGDHTKDGETDVDGLISEALELIQTALEMSNKEAAERISKL